MPLIEQLSKNYHVVTFDLPGFGRSSKKNVLYSPTLYAAFIKYIVDKFVKDAFILVGHSLGGAISLRYAATYPKNLQRLILIDVAGILHQSVITKYLVHIQIDHLATGAPLTPASLLKRISGFSIDKLQLLPLDSEIALGSPSMRRSLLDANPTKIAGLALVNEDFSCLLERVKAPCLILWGAEDNVTPLRTGRLLARKLPNARLKIIPDVGHSPMLDQPEQFNRYILSELRSSPNKSKPPHTTAEQHGIGRCSNAKDLIFKGIYKHIEITNCQNVLLQDVTADFVSVDGSEVKIENSRINGREFALRADRSRIEATCVSMLADTAILTSSSTLDLAGVELVGRQAAVRTNLDSRIVFSVSRIQSPLNNGYIHGIREIDTANPL
jgi:pimeloyl-ACP methyl ester carboxylesterase